MKVAVYARVSTHDQTAENQLLELRRYVAARGWSAVEYVDEGVSGAKDRRPALDQLVADVRGHRVQAVVCWRLDRLGRNLRHLVMLLDDWHVRGIAFVTLGRGDRHQHARRPARRRRPRLDCRVRARAHPRARARGPRAGARPRSAARPEALRGLGRSVRGCREFLDPARGRAPRRVAHGGRPLAGCKQDLSGSVTETPVFRSPRDPDPL